MTASSASLTGSVIAVTLDEATLAGKVLTARTASTPLVEVRSELLLSCSAGDIGAAAPQCHCAVLTL